MERLSNSIQSGDWKGEKHVPIIHASKNVKANEFFDIKISIGDEIPHPNTFEHHIAWVKVFFKPEKGKFPIEIASHTFNAHGESESYTNYILSTRFKTDKSGVLYALSYCNIHGLWESSHEVTAK